MQIAYKVQAGYPQKENIKPPSLTGDTGGLTRTISNLMITNNPSCFHVGEPEAC